MTAPLLQLADTRDDYITDIVLGQYDTTTNEGRVIIGLGNNNGTFNFCGPTYLWVVFPRAWQLLISTMTTSKTSPWRGPVAVPVRSFNWL